MADNKSIVVTERQVHATKNPNVMTVSIVDKDSANGFSTFPVDASSVQDVKSGRVNMKSVDLDPERSYDMSKPVTGADGKRTYEHATKTGAEIVEMFEAAKEAAKQKGSQQKQDQAQVGDPGATMKYMKDSFIHEVKGYPDLMRVSIKDEASKNGFGNFLVRKDAIEPAKDTHGVPVQGRFDVHLGKPDASVQYSIQGQDGKFAKSAMKAEDLVAKYDAVQAEFMRSRRQADKAAGAEHEATEQASQAKAPAGVEDSDFAIE